MNYNILQAIQATLKAPKSQWNSYGGFHYRNLEDIVEAVKPLLAEHGQALIISDEIVQIGDRYYVKATASIMPLGVHVHGYAREATAKKGMDEAQITGSASSYARKYALAGLLLCDDSRDADSHQPAKETPAVDPRIEKIAKDLISWTNFEEPATGYSALANLNDKDKASVWAILTADERQAVRAKAGKYGGE